jgi:serine O-acetyltransferase
LIAISSVEWMKMLVLFLAIRRMPVNPSLLWWLSCQAYQKKIFFVARLLKAINFLVFHAIFPYEAEIEKDIQLGHHGLGIVVHPNVKIGHNVTIYHHVTLATETWVGSEHKIVIGNNVMIGAGAVILGRGNQSLTIGDDAKIGANAVVTGDVLPGQTVVGIPARPLRKSLSCVTQNCVTQTNDID